MRHNFDDNNYRSFSDQQYARLAERRRRQVLVRRLRRAAKVTIAATQINSSSRSRRRHYRKVNTVRYLKRTFIGNKRLIPQSLMVLFAVLTVINPFLQADFKPKTELTPAVQSLIGESRDDASEYLKYDQQQGTYSFAAPKQDSSSGYEHTGRNADAYTASLSDKPIDGVSFTETKTNITTTIKPNFFATQASKTDNNNIVYRSGDKMLVYTLKYNGLKEDIIVPEYRTDDMSFEFTLELPTGVEPRLDNQGNIGIYSADPTLYGNISFGSDEDRARVDKARQSGKKTNLVMTIPYPLVKDSTGQEYDNIAKFELSDQKQVKRSEVAENLPPDAPASIATYNQYTLTIKASQLDTLAYPIAIDPTMRVPGSVDFDDVELQSGAEINYANSTIKREDLTGGELADWVPASSTLTPGATRRDNMGAVVIGDYLVVMNFDSYDYINIAIDPDLSGGFTNVAGSINLPTNAIPKYYNGHWYFFDFVSRHASGGPINSVHYSVNKFVVGEPIGPTVEVDMGVGTNARTGRALDIYNGYIYLSGGCGQAATPVATGSCSSGGTGSRSIFVAPINPEGSITPGSFVEHTNKFTENKTHHATVIVDGYIYAAGGCNQAYGGGYSCTSTNTTRVEYAKLNADGTVGTFVTTTSLPWETSSLGGDIFEHAGYLYMYRGDRDTGATGAVAYAQVNADHSIGEWIETAPLTTPHSHVGETVVYNNRAYIFGGCQFTSCGSGSLEASYAEIRPAGWSHGWTTSPQTFAANKGDHVQVAYNGYLYAFGGRLSGGTIANTTYYAQINTDGTLGTWNTTAGTSLPYRYYADGFAYNGYMYIFGGRGGGSASVGLATVQGGIYRAQINSNGTLSNWTHSGTNLPTARQNPAVTHYNGRLYVVGGNESSGYTTDVHYATINSDGTFGGWTQTASFATGRAGHRVAAFNGYIYLVAGWNSTVDFADVQYSAINNDGSLVGWNTTTPLTSGASGARRSGAVEIYKGNLYYIGGAVGGGFTDEIIYAPINSDGTLDTWVTATSTMPTARGSVYGTAFYNDFVYFTGGTGGGGGTYYNDTFYGRINNGGTGLATHAVSTTDGTQWGSGRYGHDSVYLNGYIYIASGRTIDCPITCSHVGTNNIRKGEVASDGTFDNWVDVTALPLPRFNHQMVAVNGYMFVVAGGDSGGTVDDLVYRASINPADGSLGSWTTLTNFPIEVRDHQATVFGDNIVVTGGFDGSDAITNTYYASVDDNGNLSSWTATDSLPTARRFHGAVGVDDKLFVLGGTTNSVVRNDVLVADVASSGALSNWRQAGLLPTARQTPIVGAANGFLYFGSGCPVTSTATSTCSNNAVDDLWVTSIGAGGGIGNWVEAADNLNGERAQATSEVINGRLYGLGGCHSGCDALTDVTNRGRFVGLASIPRKGSFFRVYDFETGVRPTHLVTRGTKQIGSEVDVQFRDNVDCGATAYDAFITNNDIGYTGANALDVSIGSGQTLAQCLVVRYSIDDAHSAVFPDEDNESYISDFDLYFTSNPGNRLRGGRTFINGTDRGLDAAPE